MDSTATTIAHIKQRLRANMNGPISHSLREKGLNYKVIFGVEWNRLCEMAAEWEKDTRLAQNLWKEDIRECRLLAGLVQPIEEFDDTMAEMWIESMRFPEEAQYTTLTLLQHMPQARQLAFKWMADEKPMFQLCGLLTITRMFMKDEHLDTADANEFLDQAECALHSNYAYIKYAAQNALLKYAQLGSEEERRVDTILNIS